MECGRKDMHGMNKRKFWISMFLLLIVLAFEVDMIRYIIASEEIVHGFWVFLGMNLVLIALMALYLGFVWLVINTFKSWKEWLYE